MKKIFLFSLLAITVFSCGEKVSSPFRWLEGTWKVEQQNDTTSVFHEKWWWDEKSNVMRGKGFEVLGKDTTWFESLSLERMNDNWFYRAHVPSEHGDDTMNFLLLTKPNRDSLVFQNEENPFPAKITYIRRKENNLTIMLESAQGLEPEAKFSLELKKI